MHLELIEVDGCEVIIATGQEEISYDLLNGLNYPLYFNYDENGKTENIIFDIGREYIEGEKEEILISLGEIRTQKRIAPGNYEGNFDTVQVHEPLFVQYGFVYFGVRPEIFGLNLQMAWFEATKQTEIQGELASQFFSVHPGFVKFRNYGVFAPVNVDKARPYTYNTSFILDLKPGYISDFNQTYEYLLN